MTNINISNDRSQGICQLRVWCILNCYASGDVYSQRGDIGGLVGGEYVDVINSFYVGNLSFDSGYFDLLTQPRNVYYLENNYNHDEGSDEDTDEESTYTVVGPYEADLSKGLISTSSPIAKALIGKRVSDSVEVRTPRGTKMFEVIGVKLLNA